MAQEKDRKKFFGCVCFHPPIAKKMFRVSSFVKSEELNWNSEIELETHEKKL